MNTKSVKSDKHSLSPQVRDEGFEKDSSTSSMGSYKKITPIPDVSVLKHGVTLSDVSIFQGLFRDFKGLFWLFWFVLIFLLRLN